MTNGIHLTEKEIDFIHATGMKKTREVAYHFVRMRLGSPTDLNSISKPEGTEEPHPILTAERATDTDTRLNIEKRYGIPKDGVLTENDIDYIVNIIMNWLEYEVKNSNKTQTKVHYF